MKYTKSQIEHVLNRFDQADRAKVESMYGNISTKKHTVTIKVPVDPQEVTATVALNINTYSRNYGQDYDLNVSTDCNSYRLRDALSEKAVALVHRSPEFKALQKEQDKLNKYNAFVKAQRQKLEDSLILGGSDALEMLDKFTAAIDKFK